MRSLWFYGLLLFLMASCSREEPNPVIAQPSPTEVATEVRNTSMNTNGIAVPTGTPLASQDVDFNVEDVRILATEVEVLAKLGKPIKRGKVKVDNCGEEVVLRFNYPGLEIDFSRSESGKEYVALSFLVTSSKWDIRNGVRIGTRVEDIIVSIGEPWGGFENRGRGADQLSYTVKGNDRAELDIKNGKLVKAKWYVDPC